MMTNPMPNKLYARNKLKRIALELMGMLSDRESNADQGEIYTGTLTAQTFYAFRRRRDRLLGNEIFGEPSWDILLDLYVSEMNAKPISISSACIAAAVPSTTALRWLNILVEHGHVERHPDMTDARRSFLSLTPETRAKLDTLFSQNSGIQRCVAIK